MSNDLSNISADLTAKWIDAVLDFLKGNKLYLIFIIAGSLLFSVYAFTHKKEVYYSTAMIDSQGLMDREILGEIVLKSFYQLEKNPSTQNLISFKNRFGNCDGKETFFTDITFTEDLNLDLINNQLITVFNQDKRVKQLFGNHGESLISSPFNYSFKIGDSLFLGGIGEFFKTFFTGVILLYLLNFFGVLKPTKKFQ